MNDVEAMIVEQEGTGPIVNGRFMPYRDPLGKWTIGYGRCIEDVGISAEEARILLMADIAIAANDARRLCSIYDELTRPRQLVLISMAYNLGYGRLSKFVRFWDALHQRNWNEAADHLLDSKAARSDAPPRYAQLARMMREDTSTWV
jgi:lysozyme